MLFGGHALDPPTQGIAELLGRPRIIMLGLRLVMHLCIEYLVHIFLFAFFLFSVQLLYNKLYID